MNADHFGYVNGPMSVQSLILRGMFSAKDWPEGRIPPKHRKNLGSEGDLKSIHGRGLRLGWCLGKPGVLRGDQAQRRPVFIGVASRHRCDEAIAYEARHRHWYILGFRGLQNEADIFESQRESEADFVVVPFYNQAAINLINRRVEKRRCQEVHEYGRIDA